MPITLSYRLSRDVTEANAAVYCAFFNRCDPTTINLFQEPLREGALSLNIVNQKVDSPIDHAIESRKGVCQDFAHVMAALVRQVKIPCRYVSGYLYPRALRPDRSSGARRFPRATLSTALKKFPNFPVSRANAVAAAAPTPPPSAASVVVGGGRLRPSTDPR